MFFRFLHAGACIGTAFLLGLNNIPLYAHIPLYLLICWWTLRLCALLTVMNNAAMNTDIQVSEPLFSIILGSPTPTPPPTPAFFFFPLFRAACVAYGGSQAGSELELPLPACTTATATWDPRHVCNLHHSSWQRWLLNPLSQARDQTCILMDTSRARYSWATTGTSPITF